MPTLFIRFLCLKSSLINEYGDVFYSSTHIAYINDLVYTSYPHQNYVYLFSLV